jgi:hypothetical protein
VEDLLIAPEYDAVFLMGSFTVKPDQLKRLAERGVRICLWHNDLHTFKYHIAFPSETIAAWADAADLVFVPFRNLWERWRVFRRQNHKVIWLPKSVPEWIFDCGSPWEERRDKILISGFSSFIYPLRNKVFRMAKQPSSRVESLPHAGYESRKNVVGRDYFRLVGSYRGAAVTTSSRLITIWGRPIRCTIAKYFEIPALGCLPFMEWTPDLAALGFVPGQHYVDIRANNLRKQFKLLDSSDAPTIGAAARRLIQERHTHRHRVETVISHLLEKVGTR